MKGNRCKSSVLILLVVLPALLAVPLREALAQRTPVVGRDRGKEMLEHIMAAVKEAYYDPKFHGIDVDARLKEAEKQIEQATSTWQVNAIIAKH